MCATRFCVIELCVMSLFNKKWCAWVKKLKSIIQRGHVDHNIYNIQTWITDSTVKGQILFTNWTGVSGMMPLVLESDTKGKCVIAEDLSSSRLINFPFSNHRPIFLHQCRWSARACVCECDVSGLRCGLTSQNGARPLLECVRPEAAVRAYRLSAFH